MTIHVYTSQSINYFNDIGKYSLASALKFLPQDTKITVTTITILHTTYKFTVIKRIWRLV